MATLSDDGALLSCTDSVPRRQVTLRFGGRTHVLFGGVGGSGILQEAARELYTSPITDLADAAKEQLGVHNDVTLEFPALNLCFTANLVFGKQVTLMQLERFLEAVEVHEERERAATLEIVMTEQPYCFEEQYEYLVELETLASGRGPAKESVGEIEEESTTEVDGGRTSRAEDERQEGLDDNDSLLRDEIGACGDTMNDETRSIQRVSSREYEEELGNVQQEQKSLAFSDDYSELGTEPRSECVADLIEQQKQQESSTQPEGPTAQDDDPGDNQGSPATDDPLFCLLRGNITAEFSQEQDELQDRKRYRDEVEEPENELYAPEVSDSPHKRFRGPETQNGQHAAQDSGGITETDSDNSDQLIPLQAPELKSAAEEREMIIKADQIVPGEMGSAMGRSLSCCSDAGAQDIDTYT